MTRCEAAGHGCGTPSGWRVGGRCPRCLGAHNMETRELRRRWSWIDQRTWHAILRAIRNSRTMSDAAARYGLTANSLHAQARVHPERAEQLDLALTQGRDPSLVHGSYTAVRMGCSCPDCRAARHRWR